MTNEQLVIDLKRLKAMRDNHDSLWQEMQNSEKAWEENKSKMESLEMCIATHVLGVNESLIVQLGDVCAFLPLPEKGYSNPKCAVRFIVPIVAPPTNPTN